MLLPRGFFQTRAACYNYLNDCKFTDCSPTLTRLTVDNRYGTQIPEVLRLFPEKIMKIAFFEVEDWQRTYFQRRINGHQLEFFPQCLVAGDLEKLGDVDILSVFIYSRIDREALSRMPSLKLIATRSTGYEHIDIDACREKGITVSNVPSYGEETVAEHTFALILSLSRKLYLSCLKRLESDFSADGLEGFDLSGKTIGVIGTGKIGLHVIRIAKGFGMDILAADVSPNDILARVMGFNYVPLDELLRRSDIVTLHVPYNRDTYHLMDRAKFAMMRKGSYLINTARGAIVDTKAMVEAIDSGQLAGVGLDVLEGEEHVREESALLLACSRLDILASMVANNILLKKRNVVYTPHIAFDSKEALERILNTSVENITFFISGSPQNLVVSGRLPVG